MKCLAIDSVYSKLTIASLNEENTVITSFNIGPRQSEKILPAIDYVLKENDLSAKDLECCILCSGPGTFTGLRLAYSSLKAIEMAYNIPVYGNGTLETYAYPYKNLSCPVLSILDAKKRRFYGALFSKGTVIIKPADYTVEGLIKELNGLKNSLLNDNKIIIAGPDAQLFLRSMQKENIKTEGIEFGFLESEPEAVYSLFSIAENNLRTQKPSLKDFDGPSYYRASEAEENLIKR